MRHPNIVEFYRAFSYLENTYVVLELCSSGSIMDMMKVRKCLSLPEIRRYLVQLCGAIKYLHSREVAHRDLKIANLFLDERMNVKVGDFGLAAVVQTDFDGDQQRRQTFCGTPNYIAPEVLDRHRKGHNEKVDIWSIGVICFVMLTGTTPFASKTQEDIYRKVKKLEYAWPKESSNFIPEEAKDVVSMCLDLDENMRPSADEIVEQPFFSMYTGCIPRSLDTSCRRSKPAWLTSEEPRGDCMLPGFSLANDSDFEGKLGPKRRSEQEKYKAAKALFYVQCGVGKESERQSRPAVGWNAGKSAFEECFDEDSKRLSPAAPLPDDRIYTGYRALGDDWSTAEPAWKTSSKSTAGSVRGRPTHSSEVVSDTLTRLGKPIIRPPPSHAASLRQQNVPKRPQIASFSPPQETTSSHPAKGLMSAMPMRPLSRSAYSSDGAKKAADKKATEVLANGPFDLMRPDLKPSPRKTRGAAAAAIKRSQSDDIVQTTSSSKAAVSETRAGVKASSVKAQSAHCPLIDSGESVEQIPKTDRDKVLDDLGLLHSILCRGAAAEPANLRQKNTEIREVRAMLKEGQTHVYVTKWVDYTNRYGIGYIMGDGTVGCVFRADGRLPPTCVAVRKGEQHIKRKKTESYEDSNQLVPQKNGQPVEFYEISRNDNIRRVSVDANVFDMNLKDSKGAVLPSKSTPLAGSKANREKWRRVKLVDAFGGYMIGSLGRDSRGASESKDDDKDDTTSSQFVKFYQRLGNVGIWGFGDGAFQFNFPDHTKIVLSQGGAWTDFYHLTPSAANHLHRKGVMQSDGYETRGFLSYPTDILLRGTLDTQNWTDINESNQIRAKMNFIARIVEKWVRNHGLGNLGEEDMGKKPTILWKGLQEKVFSSSTSSKKGGEDDGKKKKSSAKLVWVSVGAHARDAEYVSVDAAEFEGL